MLAQGVIRNLYNFCQLLVKVNKANYMAIHKHIHNFSLHSLLMLIIKMYYDRFSVSHLVCRKLSNRTRSPVKGYNAHIEQSIGVASHWKSLELCFSAKRSLMLCLGALHPYWRIYDKCYVDVFSYVTCVNMFKVEYICLVGNKCDWRSHLPTSSWFKC